jgi:Ca2+-transporting ATPase
MLECSRTTLAPGSFRANRPKPRSWWPNASWQGGREKSEVESKRKKGFERIGEIPFTSQRKMMSVLVASLADGNLHVLFTKDAPDVLLAHCTHVRRDSPTVALDVALRAHALADVTEMADDALRTLAVARRTLAAGA